MHKEILTVEQIKFLPELEQFLEDFFLAGGTAIALHIGHRQSVDFDLFSLKPFRNIDLRKKVTRKNKIERVYVNTLGEFTFSIQGIKITFFHYPFTVKAKYIFDDIIRLPALLDLAAMKAYALGQRAKWKDYVDLYFIMKKHHSLSQIIKKAKQIFGTDFNEKIFRTQLAYFQDIDYSEKVMYLDRQEISDHIIQKELIERSLEV